MLPSHIGPRSSSDVRYHENNIEASTQSDIGVVCDIATNDIWNSTIKIGYYEGNKPDIYCHH